MTDATPRSCPTCSATVPQRTRNHCPACGASMDAAAARAAPPAPAAARPVATAPAALAPALPGLDQVPFVLPLVLAAAGALLGALLWAGIARLTGYEIGYVAWAVGGLAGGGAVLGGGRGTVVAAIAAVAALGGIAGGKLYGAQLVVEHQLEAIDAMFDRTHFERMRELANRADDPPAAPGDESAADFERAVAELEAEEGDEGEGECEPLTPEQQAELAATCAAAAAAHEAELQRLRDPSYTFEQWRESQRATLRAHLPVAQLVRDSLGPIDVLFLLLGVCTAFGLVHRAR
jgi:hypothetical protein